MRHSIMILSIAFLSFTQTQVTFAADSYDYPELMVSPQASERIRLELDRENKGGFFKNHKGLQLAGMTTLLAGILQSTNVDTDSDIKKNSPKMGMIVGGGWVLVTAFLDMKYRPYREGFNRAKTVKGKSKRHQLTRERLSEEAINNAATLGKRFDYLGVATNLLAGGYMMLNVKKDTISEVTNALSIITAFAPLVFENYWSDVAKTQNGYKKKVYGPISFSPVLYDQTTKSYVSGARFAFTF
ncbi:MAG: hypothetical protein HN576_08970 [Bacteriovoracaceae bacterium]|jgi:hypothetical protein|nr:hypothetical protein [Bacteriovoracaceae bacterium]